MHKISTAIVASTIFISPTFGHDHQRGDDNDRGHHLHGARGPIARAGLLAVGYGLRAGSGGLCRFPLRPRLKHSSPFTVLNCPSSRVRIPRGQRSGFKVPATKLTGDTAMIHREGEITRNDLKLKIIWASGRKGAGPCEQ
jgi:hypothetical protein